MRSGARNNGTTFEFMTLEQVMQRAMPIFRWGFIGPGRPGPVQVGPGYRFYRIVPTEVMMVSTGLVGMDDYTREGVNRAIESYWDCVELLAGERVDVIVLGGAPISAQLGRQRVRELLDETKRRTGIPADATLESAIAASTHLDVKRLSIGSRWAPELNERLTDYMQDGGIEVVAAFGRGHWSADTARLSFEERLQLSLEVAYEAAEKAPTAEGVLVPGGAIAEHTIVPIEEQFGKTVFTNYNTEVWHSLVHTGVIAPIQGWGRLLATP
jgi:maleate cis-trans isomerase